MKHLELEEVSTPLLNQEEEPSPIENLDLEPAAEPRAAEVESSPRAGIGFTETSEEIYIPGTLSIVEVHPTSSPGRFINY